MTFTIKPNIYGGLVANILKIDCISNITGLGPGLSKNFLIRNIIIFLYRISIKKNKKVFFQNKENLDFFVNKNLVRNYTLLPGSGVNISKFGYKKYPEDKNNLVFLFIARIIKEKGIEEFLEAANVIKQQHNDYRFIVAGKCSDSFYGSVLAKYTNIGLIEYVGEINDVENYYEICHCVIFPSYYPEGISNILLEASACGRPIITTNQSGCKEVVDNGRTGYLIEPKNVLDLIQKINMFIKLEHEEKLAMGLNARDKVKREFNREKVIAAYMNEISNKK